MPTRVFLELDSEKKARITDAAISEFAEYGYENSSTNRIVKECGISKGSLFKYFDSKEDLYFYLIDTVAAEMAHDMAAGEPLPAGIYERIRAYSVMEMTWYAGHPAKGQFMTVMASERGEIQGRIAERYKDKSTDIYEALIEGADMSGIHHDRRDVLDIIRWVIEGMKRELAGKADMKEYISRLDRYMDILKNGI